MRWLLIHIFISVQVALMAQGLGVGTATPHASSILEVRASNQKGVLLPRTTSAKIKNISNPATGLLMYDTNKKKLVYYNGASWVEFNTVPGGTIVLWSGKIADIPAGWALCDGSSYDSNGQKKSGYIKTPDLRGRFVVGYDKSNNDYNVPVVDRGGADQVNLFVANLPAHNHSINSTHNHSISIANSDHYHVLDFQRRFYRLNAGFILNSGSTGYLFTMQPQFLSSGNKTIGVDVSTTKTGAKLKNSGGSQKHENRPPYYVLAYIMKL